MMHKSVLTAGNSLYFTIYAKTECKQVNQSHERLTDEFDEEQEAAQTQTRCSAET